MPNRERDSIKFSKVMSWIPPDLATLCQPHSTVSTCQPPAFMFLALIAHLYGYSQDPFHSPSRDFDSFRPWKFDECVTSNARRSSKDTLRDNNNIENDRKGSSYGSIELSREKDNESNERETVEPSIVNFEGICNVYSPRTEIVREPLTRIYDAVRIDQGKNALFLFFYTFFWEEKKKLFVKDC